MYNYIKSNLATIGGLAVAAVLVVTFPAFFVSALLFVWGVVAVVVPPVLRLAFNIFLLVADVALIWLGLLALTIFLAPVGEIRKRTYHVDPYSELPLTEAEKDHLQTEEILLTLNLPRTYLPNLLKEKVANLRNSVVGSYRSLVEQVRATRLVSLILRKQNEGQTTNAESASQPVNK